MANIRVETDKLREISDLLARTSQQVQSARAEVASALAHLEWEAQAKLLVEQQTDWMTVLAGRLAPHADEMATYVRRKAGEFDEADTVRQEGQNLWTGALLYAGRTFGLVGGLGLVPGVLGAGWAPGLLDWARRRWPDLFRPVDPQGLAPIERPDLVPPPRGPKETRLPTADEVRYIHRALGVREDGYGPKTKQAVRELQARHGIPVDSQVMIGPRTWKAIRAVDPDVSETVVPPGPTPGGVDLTPEVPYVSQHDGPWANDLVRPGTFATHGCLLSSLAMMVKYNNPGVEIDREFMLNLRDGTCNEDHDVVWGQTDQYLQQYGLTLERTDITEGPGQLMQAALEKLRADPPQPTILGIYKGNKMHWLVITGYTGAGDPLNPEDFTIHDPFTDHNWTRLDQFMDADNYRGGTISPLVSVKKA